jgi:predicted ATP-binding protein involved in virulence
MNNTIQLTDVKGVGRVTLTLDETKRVFTFIGTNGVGKTKCLESLFQWFLLTNNSFWQYADNGLINLELFNFTSISVDNRLFSMPLVVGGLHNPATFNTKNIKEVQHKKPVVFLGSQNRGHIQHDNILLGKPVGSFSERRKQYFSYLLTSMKENFSSLNMNMGIEQWFVMQAQSSNKYQKQDDNREVEIETVLRILHQIDNTIDESFIEIDGDFRVFIKINGHKRDLTQLSTGFASILKIVQSIVSGYGYFTNAIDLQNTHGIVLIDEIESHLHIKWQASIVGLLKTVFPNTVFYIATHSSVVLSQLEQGEAYRLVRNDDNAVIAESIIEPSNVSFIDLLNDAFGIDTNQLKRQQLLNTNQQLAKQQLLNLINGVG